MAKIRQCIFCGAILDLVGGHKVCYECQSKITDQLDVVAKRLEGIADECHDRSDNCPVPSYLRSLAEEIRDVLK